MNTQTLMILLAVGVGGYLLYRSSQASTQNNNPNGLGLNFSFSKFGN